RHAVLGVPGLEVGVPVHVDVVERGDVGGAGLVQVDVGAEDLPGAVDHPRVARQLGEGVADPVHLVDGAHLGAVQALGDRGAVVDQHPVVAAEPVQFGGEAADLVPGEQPAGADVPGGGVGLDLPGGAR